MIFNHWFVYRTMPGIHGAFMLRDLHALTHLLLSKNKFFCEKLVQIRSFKYGGCMVTGRTYSGTTTCIAREPVSLAHAHSEHPWIFSPTSEDAIDDNVRGVPIGQR